MLRTKSLLLDVCSVSGVIVLYLFCFIRMLFPVEFSWTRELGNTEIYNRLHDLFYYKIRIGTVIYVYQIFLIVWLTGAIFLLIHIAVQYVRVIHFFNNLSDSDCENIPDEMSLEFQKGKITVTRTPFVDTPCCIGVVKKKIIIPDKQYSDNELHYIFLHEYAHLRNNDFTVKLLTNIMCAVYWWNPFVYLLKKDLNQSMEIRCDMYVTNGLGTTQKSEYLKIMLREFKSQRNVCARDYEKIITKFLDTQSKNMLERFNIIAGKKHIFPKGKVIAWIVMSCILILSYSFVFQSEYEVPQSELETDAGTHEVQIGDTYIIRQADGKYVLHTQNKDIEISNETVEKMVQDGFKVIEERR